MVWSARCAARRSGAALQLVEVEVEAYLRHETTLDAARKREARLHGILKKVAAEATPLHRHFAQRDAARRAADAAAGERARDEAMREAFAAQGRRVAAAAEAELAAHSSTRRRGAFQKGVGGGAGAYPRRLRVGNGDDERFFYTKEEAAAYEDDL